MAQKQGSSKPARGTHSGRLVGSTKKTGNRGSKRQRPPELLLIAMDKGLGHRSKRRK